MNFLINFPKGKMNSYPKQVQIFISEICNEGCAYCPYSLLTAKERKVLLEKELTIKQWRKAVKFLYEDLGIRLFALIGGEPAAKRGIEKLIRFMTRSLPRAEVLFVTSGIPLLKNDNLRKKLVEAGMNKVIVSFNRIEERKSASGLDFLIKLKKEYPKIPFKFGANCIVNKQTLDSIIPTYQYLASYQIYLNLCPEQTLCFGKKSTTALSEKDKPKLVVLAGKLVEIKRKPGNFLIPSEDFLSQLPTVGIAQSYQCSERPFPTTIHIESDGGIPFCNWRKGEIKGKFNIMDLAKLRKDFEEWLAAWKNDKNGKTCSCSWSFPDRVGDFGINKYAN